MSKFARHATLAPPSMPQSTIGTTLTHEGARAFTPDERTALFTLAVTNMVGESTFYESAGKRDKRYVDLLAKVAASDPEWLAGFLPWLRNDANMRTAAVVGAVEFARNGGGRSAFGCLARADEPAEALAYHLAAYGKALPAAVKRGIADAATHLYTERAAVRYDSARSDVRMADVLDLTHPKPKADWQSTLFRYLLDRRHNRADAVAPAKIAEVIEWESIPEAARRDWIRSHSLPDLVSWERLSGWLPGGMDAEAWEAVIPQMGYMALLRNLRNFEDAGVSPSVLDTVAATIADPAEVHASRQFPYRFLSAWKFSETMRFGPALEAATDAACDNVPVLPGRSLVLVDVSGSMTWSTVSARSKVRPSEAAALFGAVLARRAEQIDLIAFGTTSKSVKPQRSVLRLASEFARVSHECGGGTNMLPAVARWFAGHDRIIVLTDMQAHPSGSGWPVGVPTYVWDLQGYDRSIVDLNEPGKYLFGGFSDAAFRVIGLLESTNRGTWPWQC